MKKYISLTRIQIIFCFFCLFITACQRNKKTNNENATISSKLQLPDRPNILWLVTEDMGPYIPPFEDTTIKTPNLSRLAAEGIIYKNMYSPSGVCSPSRAAIATVTNIQPIRHIIVHPLKYDQNYVPYNLTQFSYFSFQLSK